MRYDDNPSICFITTLNTNIGDDFIRDGIFSILEKTIGKWRSFYVNKHDLTTIYRKVHDEYSMIGDKIFNANIIIQAGTPVYWKIKESTCYNVEWAEEIWFKRIFKIGRDKIILNIAAGACQPYPDFPLTLLSDDKCVDFVKNVSMSCRWTSVRDHLASQLLTSLRINHDTLPCTAFLAAKRYNFSRTNDNNLFGVNIMPLSGHFDLINNFDEENWLKKVQFILDDLRKRHNLIFIAHDKKEHYFMRKISKGDEKTFYSDKYQEYYDVYSKCSVVMANRVHAAVFSAGFGIPSLIIGNDTRMLIGDYIGIESRYVLDVDTNEITHLLEKLYDNRLSENERLIDLREKSFDKYCKIVSEKINTGRDPVFMDNLHLANEEENFVQNARFICKRYNIHDSDLGTKGLLFWLWEQLNCLISEKTKLMAIGCENSIIAWYFAMIGKEMAQVYASARSKNDIENILKNTRLSVKVVSIDNIVSEKKDYGLFLFRCKKHFSDINLNEIKSFIEIIERGDIFVLWFNDDIGSQDQKLYIKSIKEVLHKNHIEILSSRDDAFLLIKPILNPNDNADVLLPRFDSLGDMILFEGFVASLIKKYQKSKFTLIVRKGYEQIKEIYPFGDNINLISVDLPAYVCPSEEMIEEFKLFIDRHRIKKCSAVIFGSFNMTWLDKVLMEELSGSCCVFMSNNIIYHKNSNTKYRVLVDEWEHETDKYKKLFIAVSGSNPNDTIPSLNAKYKEEFVVNGLSLPKEDYFVCHPGGIQNQKIKCWPVDYFADLIQKIYSDMNITPFIVGDSDDFLIIDSLASILKSKKVPVHYWLGSGEDLDVLIFIMYNAKFFVGNDSAPMHIAAACKIPVVGIFGGGTFPRFLPASPKYAAVVAKLPCFNCYWDCIFNDAPCLKIIDHDTVYSAVNALVQDTAAKSNIINISTDCYNEMRKLIGLIIERIKRIEKKTNNEIINEPHDCFVNVIKKKLLAILCR